MEIPRHIPSDLDPKEQKEVKIFFDEHRAEKLKLVTGEYEKDETERIVIDLVNRFLAEEFENLDIKPPLPIDEKQVHLVDKAGFGTIRKSYGRSEGDLTIGQADVMGQAIHINVESMETQNRYLTELSVLLHEAIHIIGYDKYKIDKNKVSTYRTGYLNTKNSTDWSSVLMLGLNEAVVEKLSQEILQTNKSEISEILNVGSEQEWDESIWYSYETEILLLELLIKKIAAQNNESYESVWNRFKKGEFTGEMMHLRDLDKTFGRGSLRVLSQMGQPDSDDGIIRAVANYFVSHDEDEKISIISKLLGEKQAEKYKKITNK